MTTDALRTFYDALPADILRQVGDSFDPDMHAMHRALRDLKAPDAPPSPATLNRLIAAAVPMGARVLDAGCGWGGTLLKLAVERGASGLGLTLAGLQAERASETATARGLDHRVRFVAADYGRYPLPEAGFDVVVAIETLIHCADKADVIKRLAGSLSSGGTLLLIDDMPCAATGAQRADLALFAEGWCAPDTPNRDQWARLIEDAGLEVVQVDDLTPLYAPRSPDELDRLDRSIRKAMEGTGVEDRLLRMGELGGIALERLYHADAMAYVMITARKP